MKVFAALFVVIASAAALGSGPYLPSGWKPKGPAFNLPSESAKPAPVSIQESEGASSNFLREYGPPQIQELPRAVTEQSFAALGARFGQDEGVEASTEVVVEENAVEEQTEEEITTVSAPTATDETADVNNAPASVVGVENEIPEEGVAKLRSGLQSAGSNIPQGFVEYGPPALREYGPPKTTDKNDQVNNETRRRRFSPKFKSYRKQRSLHRRH